MFGMIRDLLIRLGWISTPLVFTCKLCGFVVRADSTVEADGAMVAHCQSRHPAELADEVERIRHGA